MKLSDIPQRTDTTQCYRVNVGFDFLEAWLDTYEKRGGGAGVDLDPDFQRGHVWTPDQQSAFMEFIMSGGETTPIMWNIIGGVDNSHVEPLTIVDGLQRLTAIRKFLANEIPVFGHTLFQFDDVQDPAVRRRAINRRNIVVWINNLPTRAAVLKWYLEINAGGTPHSKSEIERVRGLLDSELSRP